MNKKISLRVEEWGPTVVSAVLLIAINIFAPYIAMKFGSKEWNNEGLYSSIFDWSAIQTGFAFGVYGFVVGKSDGFVKKVRDTMTMKRFMSYIKKANIAGFALTIWSIPLIIINPSLSEPWSREFICVSLWFSLFAWSFLAFLRLAFSFGRLVSVQDREFYGA